MKLQPDKIFFANLPKKRSASDVLLFDKDGRLLIVKPNYKDFWLLPGGMIEEKESPYQAAKREVKEELGLELKRLNLLGVEHQSGIGDVTEAYKFVFDGGILTHKQIDSINLQIEELDAWQFCSVKKALTILSPGISRRIPQCLKNKNNNQGAIYLENGKPIK